MKLWNKELWTELLYTLKRNKRRSFVTSLGVFAGMFFFTVLTSLSTGLRNSAFGALDSVSNEAVFFIPGRTTKPYQGYKANRQLQVNYRDYENVVRQTRLLKEVGALTGYGVDGTWGVVTVKGNSKSRSVYVGGVSSNYFEVVQRMLPLYGRLLTPDELDRGAFLCVVGRDVAKQFYDDIGEMVGTYINVQGVAFKVVGVVEAYSDAFSTIGGLGNNGIMLPLSLAVGSNYDKPLMVMGIPKSGYSEEQVKNEVFQIIARRQQVDPSDTEALVSMSMGIFTNINNMIASGINILVWIVGMGTLITGVISVSNILLVTVRERQREVGVRRAIGAKPRDIRRQFMSEAIFIIVLAGAVGTILGLLVALGIGTLAENSADLSKYIERPYPSLGLLLFCVLIMVIAGVLAGLLPVYKALQIKAIDAIRDE